VVAAPAAEAPAQPEAAPAEAAETKTAQQGCGCPRAMLFVSATCPNCKLAISMLEKAGFLFKKVLATENVELTNKYGVKQAPTLVVLGAGDDYEKFRGVSEIKGMLTARQVG
jgi:ribonucleoside-triphosphate reductase